MHRLRTHPNPVVQNFCVRIVSPIRFTPEDIRKQLRTGTQDAMQELGISDSVEYDVELDLNYVE
jgi:hypothetical protein